MSQEKKKKKTQTQKVILKEKSPENRKKIMKFLQRMEELKKEHKYVDIQVCTRCKSPRIRRVGSITGDMSGHMGWFPPMFECLDCGWRGRFVLKATNKNLGLKEIAIIADVTDFEKNK
jgi:hypothetical protein